MTGIEELSIELRENSPFAGVLSPERRGKILKILRAQRARSAAGIGGSHLASPEDLWKRQKHVYLLAIHVARDVNLIGHQLLRAMSAASRIRLRASICMFTGVALMTRRTIKSRKCPGCRSGGTRSCNS